MLVLETSSRQRAYRLDRNTEGHGGQQCRAEHSRAEGKHEPEEGKQQEGGHLRGDTCQEDVAAGLSRADVVRDGETTSCRLDQERQDWA